MGEEAQCLGMRTAGRTRRILGGLEVGEGGWWWIEWFVLQEVAKEEQEEASEKEVTRSQTEGARGEEEGWEGST